MQNGKSYVQKIRHLKFGEIELYESKLHLE